MIYLDTSALAKMYVDEIGTGKIREIINSRTAIATSKLTYAEMLSAFARRTRAGDISDREFERLVSEFEINWNYFHIVEFKDELFPIIRKVIGKYFLKGADAVHLSSALWLKQTFKADITFVASDVNLLNAANAEVLQVVNPVRKCPV